MLSFPEKFNEFSLPYWALGSLPFYVGLFSRRRECPDLCRLDYSKPVRILCTIHATLKLAAYVFLMTSRRRIHLSAVTFLLYTHTKHFSTSGSAI